MGRGGVLCGQGWGASAKDWTSELDGMREVGRWVGRTRLDGLTTNGTRFATSGIGLTTTEIRRSASGMGLNRKRSRVMRRGSKSGERGGSRAGVGSMGREGCRDIRPSVYELYPNGNSLAHEPLTGWRSGVFGVGARRLRNLTAWSCEGAGRASYEAGGSRLCAYRNNICLGSLSNQDIPDLRIYALHTEVLSPHAPPFR